MTLLEEVVADASRGVGLSKTAKGLTAIQHPGCAAAIWQRRPLERFQTWIEAQAAEDLPRARLVLRPDAVRAALTDIVRGSGLPDCGERTMLVDDISAMADIFSDVMQVPYVRLRLDVITTNACRKFHIDAVTARLVCTYRGTGTQYGVSVDGAEPEHVFTVPTSSPIVLRGTLWPEAPSSGLRHRSPPIEGTGETRLVLVLDPLNELEEDAERYSYH